MAVVKRLTRGLLLKPALNLINWILKRDGSNSLIIGGPMGWSWQATLDATHHGSLEGPTDAHRHGDLASIGTDDHHARDHALSHDPGGVDALGTAFFRTDGSVEYTGDSIKYGNYRIVHNSVEDSLDFNYVA